MKIRRPDLPKFILIFIAFSILITSSGVCSKTEIKKEELTVKKIEHWPQLDLSYFRSVMKELEPIVLRLQVSWPSNWGTGQIEFLINGQKTLAHEGSRGYEGGFSESDYFIYAGEPGTKSIDIIFTSESKKARCTIKTDFNSAGSFVPLDIADKELVLNPEPLRFLNWFCQDCQVVVNGEQQKLVTTSIYDGVDLMSCQPGLRPGLNQIHFSSVNRNGQKKEYDLEIFYAPAGRLKVGDRFAFKYDCYFYKSESTSLEIEGPGIVTTGEEEREYRYLVFRLKEDKFLDFPEVCCQSMEAREAGEAAIKIMKVTWNRGEELLKKIQLKVE